MEEICNMYNINQEIRKKPYLFIKRALEIFKSINGNVIVEIGSMRQPCEHELDIYSKPCCNDGHSSLLLARATKEFHTIDINMNNSKNTQQQLKKFDLNKQSSVYNGDGISFLQQFNGMIDLLFLDAWDIETPNHAENHLTAFKCAESKLNERNIVLIDDTDINFTPEKGFHNDEESLGGKGALLIPYLLSSGYQLQFKGRQTCLTKNI